jgi:hypothetical protein
MSKPKGLTTRDRWDAMRCDVLLVNLLGATKVSIGTVLEFGWADAMDIPIVVRDGRGPATFMSTRCSTRSPASASRRWKRLWM